MTSINTYQMEKEPFWLLEAVLCMNSVYTLDSEEWLEEKSSWSRQKKEAFLQPYRRYRDAMREELRPVFEQYPAIMAQIETRVSKPKSFENMDPPLVEFLKFNCDVFSGNRCPEGEELQNLINRSFERILSNELHTFQDDEESAVRSLADVMQMLENWNADESYKFKMIRLYVDLPALMGQLFELQKAAAEAGRKCLVFVQENYDRFYEMMEDIASPQELLEELGTIQVPEDTYFHVWSCIMSYREMNLHGDGEDSEKCLSDEGTDARQEMACFIGIDVFYILHSSRECDEDDNRFAKELKAISDPTRLAILRMLAEEPNYLQELARKLGLTPATVLHHLNTLIDMELIAISSEYGKKIYYCVQRENLLELGKKVRQLGFSRKERQEERGKAKEV